LEGRPRGDPGVGKGGKDVIKGRGEIGSKKVTVGGRVRGKSESLRRFTRTGVSRFRTAGEDAGEWF